MAPVHFDQAAWAERLAYLGLSPPPLEPAILLGPKVPPEGWARAEAVTASAGKLMAAMQQAWAPEARAHARAFAEQLEEEQGLEEAARIIVGCLER